MVRRELQRGESRSQLSGPRQAGRPGVAKERERVCSTRRRRRPAPFPRLQGAAATLRRFGRSLSHQSPIRVPRIAREAQGSLRRLWLSLLPDARGTAQTAGRAAQEVLTGQRSEGKLIGSHRLQAFLPRGPFQFTRV